MNNDEKMKNMAIFYVRIIYGFLLAPGIPGLIIYLLKPLYSTTEGVELFSIIYIIFAYATMFLIGLPLSVYLIINKYKITLLKCISYGILASLLTCCFFIYTTTYILTVENLLSSIKNTFGLGIIGIIYSIITSIIFWLIAFYDFKHIRNLFK